MPGDAGMPECRRLAMSRPAPHGRMHSTFRIPHSRIAIMRPMQVLGPPASLRRRAVSRHVRGDRDGRPRGAVWHRPDRPRSDQRPGGPRSRPRLRWTLAGRRGGAASDAHSPRPRRRRGHDRAATAGVPGLRARAWRAPHGVAGEAHRQRDADLWRPDGTALGRVRGGARSQPACAAWRRADPGGRARAGGRLHTRARPASRQLLPPRVENRLRGRHRRLPHRRDADGDAADPAARHRRRAMARRASRGSSTGSPRRCS